MARHYGIPYMGSKQKLVDKIVPFILNRHPSADSFYDLFGGGGSVSLYVVTKYPHLDTVYNELSKPVGELLKHVRDGGDLPNNFFTRSEFEAGCRGDDWLAGLLQTVWTFGNSTRGSYLYAKEIELFKQKLHEWVVDDKDNLAWLNDYVRDNLGKPGLFLNGDRYRTPYQRRIILLKQLGDKGRLQNLERLERLVHIANMPGISTLGISVGKSYDEVDIIGVSPVVYCDPPYEGTAEYGEGGFNHQAFYDWVASRDYPVYFSSYKIADTRFKLVKAINTRSLLRSSQSAEASYNYENLYWNGVEG